METMDIGLAPNASKTKPLHYLLFNQTTTEANTRTLLFTILLDRLLLLLDSITTGKSVQKLTTSVRLTRNTSKYQKHYKRHSTPPKSFVSLLNAQLPLIIHTLPVRARSLTGQVMVA